MYSGLFVSVPESVAEYMEHTDPVNGNIEWRKIEAVFLALGAIRTEGTRSSVSLF